MENLNVNIQGTKINFGSVASGTDEVEIETNALDALKSKSFIFGLICMTVGAATIAIGSYIKGGKDHMIAEVEALEDIGVM